MDYSLPEIRVNTEILTKFLLSNALLYCVVLILALKIATIFVSINFPQNIFFADITRITLENLANQTRQSLGLAPLTQNSALDQAAQMKAQNMVANNYFAHTSPTGLSPWHWFSQAGYNYKYAGENLAVGFFDSQEVYSAWINSPEHKANIVNPNYKEVGTAVLAGFGGNNTIVVVQEFGSQKLVAVPAKIKNTPIANNPPAKVNVEKPTTVAPQEKVLAQSTESIVAPSATSKAVSSVLFNYDKILQNIIYGVSLVVIGLLITLIYASIDGSEFSKALVFRSVIVVVLLTAATLFNKEILAAIIPHQIKI